MVAVGTRGHLKPWGARGSLSGSCEQAALTPCAYSVPRPAGCPSDAQVALLSGIPQLGRRLAVTARLPLPLTGLVLHHKAWLGV